jgi:hypothetical protein
MKPSPPFARPRRFPATDFCFQSDLNDWRGSSWPGGGDDEDSPARRFNEFNREFRREANRERNREWRMFALMMLIVAWPVFYMVYSVIRLLLTGNPLDL